MTWDFFAPFFASQIAVEWKEKGMQPLGRNLTNLLHKSQSRARQNNKSYLHKNRYFRHLAFKEHILLTEWLQPNVDLQRYMYCIYYTRKEEKYKFHTGNNIDLLQTLKRYSIFLIYLAIAGFCGIQSNANNFMGFGPECWRNSFQLWLSAIWSTISWDYLFSVLVQNCEENMFSCGR